MSRRSDGPRQRVLTALGHEDRLAVLAVFAEGTTPGSTSGVSPREITDRVDVNLGLVSYHVRTLEAAGIVELVGTRPVRGALEHLYRITTLGKHAEFHMRAVIARLG